MRDSWAALADQYQARAEGGRRTNATRMAAWCRAQADSPDMRWDPPNDDHEDPVEVNGCRGCARCR